MHSLKIPLDRPRKQTKREDMGGGGHTHTHTSSRIPIVGETEHESGEQGIVKRLRGAKTVQGHAYERPQAEE